MRLRLDTHSQIWPVKGRSKLASIASNTKSLWAELVLSKKLLPESNGCAQAMRRMFRAQSCLFQVVAFKA